MSPYLRFARLGADRLATEMHPHTFWKLMAAVAIHLENLITEISEDPPDECDLWQEQIGTLVELADILFEALADATAKYPILTATLLEPLEAITWALSDFESWRGYEYLQIVHQKDETWRCDHLFSQYCYKHHHVPCLVQIERLKLDQGKS